MDTKCEYLEVAAVMSLFWKENKETITIPKHEPIKIAYIKLVKNAIEQEEQDR